MSSLAGITDRISSLFSYLRCCFTKPKVKTEQFCKVCAKHCNNKQKTVFCEICCNWIHLKCSNWTSEQFAAYAKSSLLYYGISCISEELSIEAASLETCDHPLGNNFMSDGKNNSYLAVEKFFLVKKDFKQADLMFLHLNVRSLRKNIDKLEELLVLMQITTDIIAISETKLNKRSNLAPIQLPGYNFSHTDSLTRAGGVGICVNLKIRYSVKAELMTGSIDCEDIWVEVQTSTFRSKRNTSCYIAAIYRHSLIILMHL